MAILRLGEKRVIEIRPVTTIEESRHVEQITAVAWGAGLEIAVPDHLIITLAKENGGLVQLAWEDDVPVGCTLGFLSYEGEEKRLKFCSHLAAVLPEHRGKKVGEQLKWAQREVVLALGIEHITWTYDPLETLNGRLNIHKLGAICNTYQRNVYGDGQDELNWGVPTDRFYVDWWLASDWVIEHQQIVFPHNSLAEWLAVGATVINPPTLVEDLWQVGKVDEAGFVGRVLLTAVPRDFQAIKKANLDLALAWRLHTRAIFEQAFAQGFVVTDLLVDDTLCYYVLEQPQ